jgi:hypothetical protein
MTDNGRLGRRGATEAKPTKGDHDDELRQLTHRTSSGSFATFTAIRRAFIALWQWDAFSSPGKTAMTRFGCKRLPANMIAEPPPLFPIRRTS